MAQLKCPKCGGGMIEGFLLDATYGGNLVLRWHKGQPKKSWLTETKVDKTKLVLAKTYCCNKGKIHETYATGERSV